MEVRSWRLIMNLLRKDAPAVRVHWPLKALLADGTLVEEKVYGGRYLSPAGPAPGGEVAGVRLLAPFDPLVWDRVRFAHLFGWEYKFEAYTPAAKRLRGHYALPLYRDGSVIGWANVTYRSGSLAVQTGFAHGQPRSRAFQAALDEELDRLRSFLASPEGARATPPRPAPRSAGAA